MKFPRLAEYTAGAVIAILAGYCWRGPDGASIATMAYASLYFLLQSVHGQQK